MGVRKSLQRDLMPWPDDVQNVFDFGAGEGVIPDLRPDSPAEMVSLQFLAHAALTYRAGEVVHDLTNKVMSMAFGEFVWEILDRAMDLLDIAAEDPGAHELSELAGTGREAANLVSVAFPAAFMVFTGPAGFPDPA